MSNKSGINSEYIAILLKITGIAILTEFAVSLCKDARRSSHCKQNRFRRKGYNNKYINSNNISTFRTYYKSITMKKIFILICIILCIPSNVVATDSIISSQLETLNLESFIEQGEQYTKEVFKDVDLSNLLKSAISGNIDNKTIYANILLLLGEEILEAVTILGRILIIIVIHSILKNINENLGNSGVSEVAYYVEYILIVTLAMYNFSEVIFIMKEAITNLVGYINTLVPILLALITATRKCCNSKFYPTSYNFCNSFYK